jgi:hypothetical protein
LTNRCAKWLMRCESCLTSPCAKCNSCCRMWAFRLTSGGSIFEARRRQSCGGYSWLWGFSSAQRHCGPVPATMVEIRHRSQAAAQPALARRAASSARAAQKPRAARLAARQLEERCRAAWVAQQPLPHRAAWVVQPAARQVAPFKTQAARQQPAPAVPQAARLQLAQARHCL